MEILIGCNADTSELAFKIDLIVWKSSSTYGVPWKPVVFKIDLIVWKYVLREEFLSDYTGLK